MAAEIDPAAEDRSFFGQVGSIVVRWPLLVIAAWVVLAVSLTQAFPSLALLAQKAPAAILPADAPSVVTTKEMMEAFQEASSENILMVALVNENGLTDADEAVYGDLVNTLRAQTDDVAALQDFISTPPLREILVSEDGKAWLLPVNIVGEIATPKAIAATKRVIETVQSGVAGTTVTAYTTGPAGTFDDINDIGERDRITIEVVTVVVLLLILLVVYRNPLTMMLPLITIGVALLAAQGVVAGMGTLGLSVSNQTIVLMTAMMFGAGVDYAVFLIARYHDYLRLGQDPDTAVRGALVSVGKVIFASAFTVAVTFLGMVFTKLTVFYTVGAALSAAILVGCFASVTFLPALLVLAGRRGWAKPRRDLTTQFWRRSGIRLVRRPVVNLLASVLVLGFLASIAALAQYNYDDRKALPTSSASIRGYDAIGRHFSINASLPQYILITSPTDLRTPEALADMEQMAYRVSQVPDIDIVRGITRPTGEPLEQATLSFQAGEVGTPLGQAADTISSNTGNLDALAGGADQIADVLGAVRGQLGQALGTVGVLVDALTYLQNTFGGASAIQEFDAADNLLNTVHGLGNALGTDVSDAIETFDHSIQPVLNALNASPVCDADPACVAARAQLQQAAIARDNGTLDRIGDLARQLQAVHGYQTLGATADNLRAALDAVNQSLQATGISSPAEITGQLNQLTQGVETLAQGSRQVADGVQLLVDQTKTLGAGLDQASSFLLSMKYNATTPSMAGFYIPAQILTGAEFRKAASIFISADGRSARYLVQTKLDPFTPAAMDQVNAVTAAARSAQPNTTLADASISMTGFTVTLRDTRDYYYRDLARIVITTILVVLGILVILLRALVAPVYLVASVVLSYLSSLGLAVVFFQFILGQEIHWSVPGLTFIISVAMGADYSMLLISRIRDESPRGIRSGVVRTVTQTGGVITVAGLIFSASMIGLQFSSIATLVQIGFIISIGILLDTFVVRTLTVPAFAVLVGKANWWPSKWQPSPHRRPAPQPEPEPVPVGASSA